MRRSTRIAALLLALVLLAAAAGCSAAKNETAAMDSAGTSSSTKAESGGTAPMAPASAPMEMADAEEAGGLSAGTSGVDGATAGILDTEKIIYTAYAQIETRKFDQTIADVNTLVGQYGAFVQSSSVTGSDYYSQSRGYSATRRAEYVLRVPRERFQELMDALPTLGNVPYCDINTENITREYADTDARLEACRIQQERLLELLEQAESVEDMLTIEGYLTDVRYEIESLTSQLQNWDALISYSTVTLNINEVEVYTEEPVTQQTYWQKLGSGLSNTIKGIGAFFKEAFRLLVTALPVLILLGVLAVAVLLIVRGCRRRRRRRRAEAQSREQTSARDE